VEGYREADGRVPSVWDVFDTAGVSTTIHASCVDGLRSLGTKQVCPMCRVELPPGREKLLDEATRRYLEMQRQVDSAQALWSELTKAQQLEMNEVTKLWRLASD
jgi:hypothetical protein